MKGIVTHLWRSLRSGVYGPLAEAYENSLRWERLDDLKGIDMTTLRSAERFRIPSGNIPFLVHTPADAKDLIELPAPRTALLERPLYSAKYGMVFLSRHRPLVDSLNDRYPFRIGLLNLYGRHVHELPGYSTSLRARWNNYYHLLIDVLPRLELLRRPHFDQHDRISLICPGGLTPLEDKFLGRLGLPPNTEILDVDEEDLYRPEKYVFLSFPTLRYCGAVPRWYMKRIREAVCPRRPSKRMYRILISRQRAKKRQMTNFDELKAALEPMGFDVVELETLDFESQVELFYDAEVVVGTHGAGLTNVLFSDRAKVVEIFPSWYVMPHYLYLCASLDHSYRFSLSSDPPSPEGIDERRRAVLDDLNRHNDADFCADVEHVVTTLRQMVIQ